MGVAACKVDGHGSSVGVIVPDAAPISTDQTVVSRPPIDFEEAARVHVEGALAGTPGNQAHVARVERCGPVGYLADIREQGYEVFPLRCVLDVCAFEECTRLDVYVDACGVVVDDNLGACSAAHRCGVRIEPARALASAESRLEVDALEQLDDDRRVLLKRSELGGLAWVYVRAASSDGVAVLVSIEVDVSTGDVVAYRRAPEDDALNSLVRRLAATEYRGPWVIAPVDAECPRAH